MLLLLPFFQIKKISKSGCDFCHKFQNITRFYLIFTTVIDFLLYYILIANETSVILIAIMILNINLVHPLLAFKADMCLKNKIIRCSILLRIQKHHSEIPPVLNNDNVLRQFILEKIYNKQ